MISIGRGVVSAVAVACIIGGCEKDDPVQSEGLPEGETVEDTLVFADDALEMAVRRGLGGTQGAITRERALMLQELAASGEGIESLDGIEDLANLRVLDIADNLVSDLAPLSSLKALQYLDLSGNPVKEVAALAELARLKVLVLTRTEVGDLSPLLGLVALEQVELSGTSADDGAVLELQARGVEVHLETGAVEGEVPTGMGAGQHIACSLAGDIYLIGIDGITKTNLTSSPEKDTEPTWSPDGTRIAFASGPEGEREIHVLDRRTGSITNLTDHSADDYAPAWSPSGEAIVFVSDRDDIEVCPEFRGACDDVFVLDVETGDVANVTRRFTTDGEPTWSPDGEWIAFSSSRDGELHVFVTRPDGGEAANVSRSGEIARSRDREYDPAWSPDGRSISFVRRWNLQAVRWSIEVTDPQGGEQIELVEESNQRKMSPTWSPDGRHLAYALRDGIVVMDADGTNARVLVAEALRDDGHLAWEPDVAVEVVVDYGGALPGEAGSEGGGGDGEEPPDTVVVPDVGEDTSDALQVVFVSDITGNPEVYLMDSDGSDQVNVTQHGAVDLDPAFSPDGQLLAFTSGVGRGPTWDVYLQDGSGRDAWNLTQSASSGNSPSWAPDGRRIAYVVDGAGFRSIYTVATGTGDVVQVSSDSTKDYGPAWSPNSSRIAYVSAWEGVSEIRVVDADDGQVSQVTQGEEREASRYPAKDCLPAWAPDGERLAYVVGQGGRQEICVVDMEGGAITQLTYDGGYKRSLSWSPDGAWIVYNRHESSGSVLSQLMVIGADSAGGATLTDGAYDTEPAWSPDGHQIVFVSNRDGAAFQDVDIFAMDADGGNVTRLTDHGLARVLNPGWVVGAGAAFR